MKFLLDQCVDARLIPYLEKQGHDAIRIGKKFHPGAPDEIVLEISIQLQRILITDDRDFGELIFRHKQSHNGVIFLRLGEYAAIETKSERLQYVLDEYADFLDTFIVVTMQTVKIRREKGK